MAFDCFLKNELWAPSLECFNSFESLFEQFEVDFCNIYVTYRQ